MKKLCDLFSPIQIQEGIYFCRQNEPLKLEKPDTFIAMIPQGRACIVPQKNHWLICNAIAIITPDNYLLEDLSRFYPWKLPNCDKHDPRSHPIFTQEDIPPLEILAGNVVILSTLAAHVYYHWLIDLIPRLGMMIRSGLNLDKVDWFVVNNLNNSYQKETLQKLGIPLEKIVESDRHPHLQAQRLIVPSWPGDLDWPLSGTINFLRETYLPKETSNQKKYPTKIYISRAKSRHRHIINEPEVLDLITQYGFIPIFLENFSFSEQIAIFNHAEYIIAPHGSGLTNLLFCNPDTTVIEFFAPRYVRSDYLIISQQLQLKHYYLLGENFECYPVRELIYDSPITDDILVKIEQLQTLLTLLFSKK
jgi:capsular polysaccharide biosynthesis protein